MSNKSIPIAVAALAALGCIVGETRHTLYLEPDGAVAWTVTRVDVRSDASDPVEREREESGYLLSILRNEDPISQWLQGLDPVRFDLRILRSERPFSTFTEAEYRSAGELVRTALDALGMVGSVESGRCGTLHRLTVRFDVGATPEPTTSEREALWDAALQALDGSLRVVLTEGAFVAASGFELHDDGRVAVPLPYDDLRVRDADGASIYSLVWAPAADDVEPDCRS